MLLLHLTLRLMDAMRSNVDVDVCIAKVYLHGFLENMLITGEQVIFYVVLNLIKSWSRFCEVRLDLHFTVGF